MPNERWIEIIIKINHGIRDNLNTVIQDIF